MLGSHVHLDLSDFSDEVVRYLIFLSVQSSSVLLMNTEVTKQMIYPKGERSEPLDGLNTMNPVVCVLWTRRWLDLGG